MSASQPGRGISLGIVGALLVCGCAAETPTVSFANDVRPILDARCVECHQPGAEGHEVSGLALENYEDLMRGTKFGPVVIPGDTLTSALIILIEGRADPAIAMPHNRWNLSQPEIDTIKAWVEQGAKDN